MPIALGRLPRPFDTKAAEALAARFAERGAPERAFAASATGAALLAAMGGHSSYLADLAVRESATLLRLVERGPDAAFALALDPLGRADPDTVHVEHPVGAAVKADASAGAHRDQVPMRPDAGIRGEV